jgi:hypothetical protein
LKTLDLETCALQLPDFQNPKTAEMVIRAREAAEC